MTETESAWASRVSAWRSSGESASEYGARIGFAAATLRWWASELGRRGLAPAQARAADVKLARVEVRPSRAATSGSGVRLSVGALRIELDRGFDPETLRAVVAALGAAEAR